MDRLKSIPKEQWVAGVATLVVLALVALAAFAVLYAGRALPGVTVNGKYIGGLNKQQIKDAVVTAAEQYRGQQITIQYGNQTLGVPVSSLAPQYPETAAGAAIQYGRAGGAAQSIWVHVR